MGLYRFLSSHLVGHLLWNTKRRAKGKLGEASLKEEVSGNLEGNQPLYSKVWKGTKS